MLKLISGRLSDADQAFQKRAEDCAARVWCRPVQDEVKLACTKAFHEALYDRSTMEISHCKVCYRQTTPENIHQLSQAEFDKTYKDVEAKFTEEDRGHFSCRQCFPSEGDGVIDVCMECEETLRRRKIPDACRVNNMALGCVHRYPEELKELSPLEERLIGIYSPSGWITKLTIDNEQETSGKYRKHKRGHILVFPNDVERVATDVLPHPLVSELKRVHVCFVGPRKPEPKDLGFMLTVRPDRLKAALAWLKQNNPLYQRITISEAQLEEWGDWADQSQVSQQLFDGMFAYEQTAEDEIRGGHYVPAAERGRPEEPEMSATDVLRRLEDRDEAIQALESSGSTRMGAASSRARDPGDMDPRHIEMELAEIKSTGLITMDNAFEASLEEKLHLARQCTGDPDGRYRGRKPDNAGTQYSVAQDGRAPFVVSRRGEEFADSHDPEFFPKAFPCLFPWGRGGPKALGIGDNVDDTRGGGKSHGLKKWAQYLLQRHGGHFATHSTFMFLVFNMLVKSANRRVSYARMRKTSFATIEEIVRTLTEDEVAAAAVEYEETRTTTNSRVAFLMREMGAYGGKHHMSNEERLKSRRQIFSMILKFGMPCVWFTINPNDLSNPVNMVMGAHRAEDGEGAQQLLKDFAKGIGRVHHTVRDAVSSATFFNREIQLFFKHYTPVGKQGIFGKTSAYFANVETNERGALHLHGFVWLDANLGLPNLFIDVEKEGYDGDYAKAVCAYLDSVFSESCDMRKAKSYRRFDSVFDDIVHITSNPEKYAKHFQDEANWVASKCQMHSCGATCTKYSYRGKDKNQHPCRFKAPWAIHLVTEFTGDGVLRMRRDHSRINRYSPALTVGMRHNTDTFFLPTNSAALSMVYYATNYATKLDAPMWKRVVMVLSGLERRTADDAEEAFADEDERTVMRNNRARQFMARVANQVFTSRELSAPEVAASLMDFPNSYSSENRFPTININTLYWALFRRWDRLKTAAGPLKRQTAPAETIGIHYGGLNLTYLDAYPHRGHALADLCFYDYVSMFNIAKQTPKSMKTGKRFFPLATTLEESEFWVQELVKETERCCPTMQGQIDPDPSTTTEDKFKSSAVVLLALFVPWHKFTDHESEDPIAIWEELRQALPGRLQAIVANAVLLKKSAEDAKKDAQLWASRAEGDEGIEYEAPEDTEILTDGWEPQDIDSRRTFHELVAELDQEGGVARNSADVGGLLRILNEKDFSNKDDTGDDDVGSQDIEGRDNLIGTRTMQKSQITSIKASQDRLHKQRMLTIEGDEDGAEGLGALAGFGDDEGHYDTGLGTPPATQPSVEARAWVEIGVADTFARAGRVVGAARTLNKEQSLAVNLFCDALDRHANGSEEQHLQYVGGGGGTGKSWVIDAMKDVMASMGQANKIVVTATSGTAAAGIGGTTVHSAVGLSFRERNGALDSQVPGVTQEKAKERWRRRNVLVIDEASMLGLKTLYDIDQRLRLLRGFPDKPFGGLPVVIFTGDFLQFSPVSATSLLADLANKPLRRKTDDSWKESEAKKIWDSVKNVVLLTQQKRAQEDQFLVDFLDRLRQGLQTREDMERLAAQYDPTARIDLSDGRRGIIPVNQDRWDLTLHAALGFSRETGRKLCIYLSNHHWKSRMPSAIERRTVMQLGDAGNEMPIAGVFPYVEGMPVIVNANTYMGLKVVNGAEFTAVGIVHPPGLTEIPITETISVFTGPPRGIILQSATTKGLRIPGLPEDTVMVPALTRALGQKHAKAISQGVVASTSSPGITRTGLPCTPGFVLTAHKSQGRTLGKTLLGLYGRRRGEGASSGEKCDTISIYVQLSRGRRFEDIALIEPLKAEAFLEARMPDWIVRGMKRLEKLAEDTSAAYEASRSPTIL